MSDLVLSKIQVINLKKRVYDFQKHNKSVICYCKDIEKFWNVIIFLLNLKGKLHENKYMVYKVFVVVVIISLSYKIQDSRRVL